MHLQNDVNEIKTSTDRIAQTNSRQMRFIDSFMATAGTGQLPAAISRGYAILVDATGREHTLLLDQCRYFDVCPPQLKYTRPRNPTYAFSN